MMINIKLGFVSKVMDYFFKDKPGIAWSPADLEKPIDDINLVFARPDVPDNAPSYLQDTYSTLITDRNGQRVVRNMCMSFLMGGGFRSFETVGYPVLRAWIVIARMMMVLVAFAAATVTIVFPGWVGGVVMVLGLIWFSAEHLHEGLNTFGFSVIPNFSASKKNLMGSGIWFLVKLGIFYATIVGPTWLRFLVWPWIPYMASYRAFPNLRDLSTVDQLQEKNDFHFKRSNALIASPVYQQMYKLHCKGRIEQSNACQTNDTPYVPLGLMSLGILSRAGDLNAADEGMEMGTHVSSMCPGILVFGPPGSGKTSGLLRPIIRRLYDLEASHGTRVGMFVEDNKAGALPMEAAMLIPGFVMLSPNDVTLPNGRVIKAGSYAMMAGLNSAQVAEVLTKLLSMEDKSIWPGAARALIDKFCNVLEVASHLHATGKLLPLSTLMPFEVKDADGKKVVRMVPVSDVVLSEDWLKWNVVNAVRLLDSVALVAAIGYLIPSEVYDTNDHLYKAITYLDTYRSLSDGTRTSIQMTAATWMNDLTGNREIYNWLTASAEEGVRVEDIFQGAHIGLYCPETIYGIPGVVASQFASLRISNEAKRRGDESIWKKIPGQTYAFRIVDEGQVTLGDGKLMTADAATTRSLGLGTIFGTQSVEGMEAIIGEPQTKALLSNFSNLIGIGNISPKTAALFEERMGTIAKVKPVITADEDAKACGVDWEGSCNANAQTAKWTGNIETYDQARLENNSVSFNEGTSGPSQASGGLFTRLMQQEHALQSIFHNTVSNSMGKSLSYKHVGPENINKRFVDGGKVYMEYANAFDPVEHGALLYTRGTAVVLLNVGGHPRKEIVMTTRVYAPDMDDTPANAKVEDLAA